MKKFYLIADVRAYAEVEAENEADARDKANALPMSAWDFEEHVDEVWSIEEAD